uniref:Secreted protein n=1 Tax=Bicosoecida sp. CB-2014 TaxID=1486930 RepID=A0A7S1CP16_9STRA
MRAPLAVAAVLGTVPALASLPRRPRADSKASSTADGARSCRPRTVAESGRVLRNGRVDDSQRSGRPCTESSCCEPTLDVLLVDRLGRRRGDAGPRCPRPEAPAATGGRLS